jgi:thymidylate kinase
MIHKIIITEGLDRSGKGTALEQLEIDYTAKGYTVRTIFTPSKVDISFQEQANAAYFEFVRFKQKLGAHINYDMFSFGALEMVRSILQAYSTHPEKHVILIDLIQPKIYLCRFSIPVPKTFRNWSSRKIDP